MVIVLEFICKIAALIHNSLIALAIPMDVTL